MSTPASLATRLREAAREADHRRLIVLHGSREATEAAAREALDAAREPGEQLVLVGEEPLEGVEAERVGPDHAARLMGTTHPLVVLDARDALDPRALGRVVGAVDGGGLMLILAPPLDDWPTRRDGFDAFLAVEPYTEADVGGRFRQRLVATLREHEGVALLDADTGEVEDDGQAPPADAPKAYEPRVPPDAVFPAAAYEACRTRDQARALHALEALTRKGAAVVVEADRGRGKSSAAGLAAGGLAAEGARVVVTAPDERNTRELFARARELLEALGHAPEDESASEAPRLAADAGGHIVYVPPAEALEAAERADAVLVDEAAGLPVHRLAAILDAGPPSAFATTIHGYEGAGRGFSVRFKDRLADHEGPTTELSLSEPIRYAPGDPLEAWAFRALLLDARPPVDALVEDARPSTTTYERLDPDALVEDEHRLREAFGLLVLAHYRTSPRDLARLLDAPNLDAHALLHEGHVACVALVAREGGLSEERCRELYEGDWIDGHMIPDVLTSQLRDEHAARPTGARVMRIATHPAARRRGLASRLLDELHQRLEPDWFGTGYGATPGLLSFWQESGYRTVHVGTSKNPASGEHSAVMLRPRTEAGQALHERSTRWLAERIASVLADGLRELDVDVARAALAASDAAAHVDLDLSERAWRHVAACTHGPGVYDANPRPFRRLAVKHLAEQDADLDAGAERLLVAKVLQAHDWERVVDELGYVSTRMAMKALAAACEPLLARYGPEDAREDAGRYDG